MALGKPVIAYDTGGTKIIKNGLNGVLIKDENDLQIVKLLLI